jgi:hypothetical protein
MALTNICLKKNHIEPIFLIQYLQYGHQMLRPPSELPSFGNNKMGSNG